MPPIQQAVAIFGENVSFDHYFGTYPNAQTLLAHRVSPFSPIPSVNGLIPALLTNILLRSRRRRSFGDGS